MNLRPFARKQLWRLRRLRSAAMPAALALVLSLFALVQLPSANTLWSQDVSFNASVSTGTFACQPYTITLASTSHEGGNTTFTYTFSGGGRVAEGDNCAHDISYVALNNVCFNPKLAPAGDVLTETHPASTTNPPSHWEYTPANKPGEKRVKWDGIGVGTGPFSNTFSITLPGNVPTVPGEFDVHAGNVHTFGDVAIPDPASCHVPENKATLGGTNTFAPLATTSDGTAVATPTATGSTPTPVQPSATPSPTPSPTATPTPRPVGAPAAHGSAIARHAPTPVGE